MRGCLLCLAVMMVCLFGAAFAENPSDFTFMESITWETTLDQAMEFFGESAQRRTFVEDGLITLDTVHAANQLVYGTSAEWVELAFYQGELFGLYVAYTQEAVPDRQALLDAYCRIYGEGLPLNPNSLSMDDFINQMTGIETIRKWEIGENTRAMLQAEEGHALPYNFYAEHLSRMELINRIILENIDL